MLQVTELPSDSWLDRWTCEAKQSQQVLSWEFKWRLAGSWMEGGADAGAARNAEDSGAGTGPQL